MSGQSSVARGRYGFERHGWWPALGVVLGMAALWLVPTVVADALPDHRSAPVDPTATYALTSDSGVEGTVTPADDWTTSTGDSGPDLAFASGATAFVAHLDTGVDDVDRLWDRKARMFALAEPPLRLSRHGTHTSATGLSGPAGTIADGNVSGEVFLLAADGPSGNVAMVSVTGPPGTLTKYTDDFDAFLDSVELKP